MTGKFPLLPQYLVREITLNICYSLPL